MTKHHTDLAADTPPLVRLCTWLARLDGWATYYESPDYVEGGRSREPMSGRDRAQALYLLKERAMKAIYTSQSPAVKLGILEAPVDDSKKNRDYYSLYVLVVDYGPLGRWQFHTPVPVGQSYLPQPRAPECPVLGQRPVVQGRFQRLGRALPPEERRAYPEAEVVFQIWQALKALSRPLPKEHVS